MQWYRLALKKYAISYKDFFKFYALSAIPNEVFEKNPVFLFEFIEHLNIIRNYYLQYLLKEIGQELDHASERIDKINLGKSGLIKLVEVFGRKLPSDQDFYKAKQIFNDKALWDNSGVFGGKVWADIAEWTQKLYNMGILPQKDYTPQVIAKTRYLAFILDVIHSLEHNTSSVLVALPQEEKNWLNYALDAIKNIVHPYYVARISGDSSLANLYWREINPEYMPLNDDVVNQSQESYQEFYRAMDERGKVEKELQKLKHQKIGGEIDSEVIETENPDLMKAALFTRFRYLLDQNKNFISNLPEILNFILKYSSSEKFLLSTIVTLILSTAKKQNLSINEILATIDLNAFSAFDLMDFAINSPDLDLNKLNAALTKYNYTGALDYLRKNSITDENFYHNIKILVFKNNFVLLQAWLDYMYDNSEEERLNLALRYILSLIDTHPQSGLINVVLYVLDNLNYYLHYSEQELINIKKDLLNKNII